MAFLGWHISYLTLECEHIFVSSTEHGVTTPLADVLKDTYASYGKWILLNYVNKNLNIV